MNRKQHNGEAGYVAERMSPFFPGKKVVIYKAEEQGMDVDGCKYAVVCDQHGSIVGTSSLPDARGFMKYPEFCEPCMAIGTPREESSPREGVK